MERDFFTVSEVCGMTGLSDWTVKSYIAKGKLRAYRPSKKLLIRKSDFQAFLATAEVTPKVS